MTGPDILTDESMDAVVTVRMTVADMLLSNECTVICKRLGINTVEKVNAIPKMVELLKEFVDESCIGFHEHGCISCRTIAILKEAGIE